MTNDPMKELLDPNLLSYDIQSIEEVLSTCLKTMRNEVVIIRPQNVSTIVCTSNLRNKISQRSYSQYTSRLVDLLKKWDNQEKITALCSALLTYTCGEAARGEIVRDFQFHLHESEYLSFKYVLPPFVLSDVGCRVWGSTKALCIWILQNMDRLKQLLQIQQEKIGTLIELGCGTCPLLGAIASVALEPSNGLVFCDFSKSCLEYLSRGNLQEQCKAVAAYTKKDIQVSSMRVSYQEVEWTDMISLDKLLDNHCSNGLSYVILGSAVVYEAKHAEEIPCALQYLFRSHLPVEAKNAAVAVIAIHEEHEGFEKFEFNLRNSASALDLFHIVGPMIVLEDDVESKVWIFFIRSKFIT